MLHTKKRNSVSTLFRPEVVARCGMNGDLPFKVVSVEAEQRNEWDPDKGAYTDTPFETIIYVCQDAVSEDGEIFRQNPIQVLIPVKNLTKQQADEEFPFGTEVVFKQLGGYFSRKKKAYIFHAENIAPYEAKGTK